VDNNLPVGLKFTKCLDERVKPRGNWPKRLGFRRFGTVTRGLYFSRHQKHLFLVLRAHYMAI
jgi:hypothetical protein